MDRAIQSLINREFAATVIPCDRNDIYCLNDHSCPYAHIEPDTPSPFPRKQAWNVISYGLIARCSFDNLA